MARTDEGLLATARRFVKRVGAPDEPVLLALSTGHVAAHGLPIPRLNVSPLLVIGLTRWWIADRHGERFHARGRTKNIIGTFATSDSVTVCLSEKENVRFGIGQMYVFYVNSIIDGVLAHARLGAAKFADIAPGQPPLLLTGTHVGGTGTNPALAHGEPCVVAVSGRGVCAAGPGSVFMRPADRLRAVWVGGITGPIEDAALASLMNVLMMRRHADCLVRFVFDDTEATFSLAGENPGRLQLDLAALTGAIGGPSAPAPAPAVAPQPTAAAAPVAPASTGWAMPSAAPASAAPAGTVPAAAASRFCGHCGASREPAHAFCTGCGKPFSV